MAESLGLGQSSSGRAAVGVVALLALFASPACGQLPPQSIHNALPTDSIFAPSSFWYSKIPVDAPVHPQSEAFVADLIRQKNAFFKKVSINLAAYSSPVYVVDANVSTVVVEQCKQYPGRDRGLAAQWAAVPIPEYAEPADGTDAEMTIYQPSTDTIWEFWKAKKVGPTWQACWGGKMTNVSRNDGRWPGAYGTTATGLPFLGGQITAEELKRGEIRHAIGISLPELESRHIFSWPAKRSDGFNPRSEQNRIPEGLRFRLDPTIDVSALKIRPVAKIIARAAQIYGFVVWDHAGAVTVRAQNPKSYTKLGQVDPYPELFGKIPAWAVFDGFPWEQMRFLPHDYGKP